MLGTVVPGQGRPDFRLGGSAVWISVFGEMGGIDFALHDVTDDPQAREADDVLDDDRELQVHP